MIPKRLALARLCALPLLLSLFSARAAARQQPGQSALTLNAIGFANQLSTVAVDFSTRAPVSLNDNVKRLIGNRFDFAAPVFLARFSDDGKRLLVLTVDQTVYVLDLTAK